MLNWFRRRPARPIPDCDVIAQRQASAIKKIASKHLNSVSSKGRRPTDLGIVVPYEDMLRIWDLADQLKWRI